MGTPRHRLDPLLRPRSVAVVGASERDGSVGRRTVHNLLAGGYEGEIYPINPGRDSVLGLRCYSDLESLPGTAEHVAFAVSDARIEGALAAAIDHGARAATIMSQLVEQQQREPSLQARVNKMIHDADLLVCGANAMGFYNCTDGVWLCGFDTRDNHVRGGNVTLISQSGSGMSGIVDCEERMDFNLAVSTGMELSVGMADYMDFAIEAHSPRVIGLFMETVRDPQAMIAALEKANDRRIPVVALKVGRTAFSARMAQSHSGAIAGDDAAYEALFDCYGVQRVGDMHALVSAMMLFAQPHRPGPGGLVTLHDSGGERQLLIDLADEMRIPLAELGPDTTARLESLLDPGLPPVNPLDAWGAGGPDADETMARCLAAMMADEQAAIGAVVHDRAPHGTICPDYVEYLAFTRRHCERPLALVSNHQGSGADPLAIETTRAGFPVMDGLRPFLEAVRCMLDRRDFESRSEPPAPALPETRLAQLRDRLAAGCHGEAEGLALLRDLGLPVVHFEQVRSADEAANAATKLGFPAVVKTAAADVAHKTDRGGVVLNLKDSDSVVEAWKALDQQFGPETLVMRMAEPGLELMLGMVTDQTFGPLVIIGLGGVDAERERDRVALLPPFSAEAAMRRIRALKNAHRLEARRGCPAPDLDAFCEAAALFSAMVASLGDEIAEMDINPIIVHASGCVAVDALVIADSTHSE